MIVKMVDDSKYRRRVLEFMLGSGVIPLAGCTESEFDDDSEYQDDGDDSANSQSAQENSSEAQSTVQADTTTASESRQQAISADDITVDLPDNPVETTGEVPVQRVNVDSEHDSQGYSDGEARIEDTYTETRDRGRSENAYISVTSEHRGSGQVSGFALSTFQTAWRAPNSGTYRATIPYQIISAQIMYSDGEDPNVDAGISQDLSATVTRVSDLEVLTETTEKYFEYGQGEFSEEMEDFFVTTAAKLVVAYALGLGLVGRVLLTAFIHGLSGGFSEKPIEEPEFQENMEKIDELTVEFSAEEGEVYALEFIQTVSIAYEQDSSIVSAYTQSNTNLIHFEVEEV